MRIVEVSNIGILIINSILRESPAGVPSVVDLGGLRLRDNLRLAALPTLEYVTLYHALTTLAYNLPLICDSR